MTKISSLTSLTGAGVDQANDLLTIVDMSETGAARNKKITVAELLGLITDIPGVLEIKGATDCSTDPNYPAADKGDFYVVSVAGKIGGASGTAVEVGDAYFALADNAGGTQAGVGSSWAVIQGNILSGAVGIGVEDEGVSEATGVTVLNFTGSGVSAADAGGGQVDVTIPGGISTFALGDATDVDTTGAAAGDVLAYDGAEWVPQGFRGARVYKATGFTPTTGSTTVISVWDTEDFDEGGWWSAGAPANFVVPAGVTYIGATVTLFRTTSTADQFIAQIAHYNAADAFLGLIAVQETDTAGGDSCVASAAPFKVAAGDIIKARYFIQTANDVEGGKYGCSFAIVALG